MITVVNFDMNIKNDAEESVSDAPKTVVKYLNVAPNFMHVFNV